MRENPAPNIPIDWKVNFKMTMSSAGNNINTPIIKMLEIVITKALKSKCDYSLYRPSKNSGCFV